MAIGIVFLAHCGLEKIVPGGFGVTIFFFLSGYLITSLLRSEAAQTGRIDLRAFYVRRTLRIWPPLYITVTLAAVLTYVSTSKLEMDQWAVAAQFGFFINYADFWGHANGVPALPLWSLAVEEHFYLLFPLLYAWLLMRWSPVKGAIACLALAAVTLSMRVFTVWSGGDMASIYYLSHTRFDSILFGCCLALWNNPVMDRCAWKPRSIHVAAAIGLVLLSLVLRDETFRQTLRYTIQGCALFVIFSFIITDDGFVKAILSSGPVRVMASYSYTFYLAHMFIIDRIVEAYLSPSFLSKAVVGGSLTLLYCAVMYRFVEQPIVRWRKSAHKVDAGVVPAKAG